MRMNIRLWLPAVAVMALFAAPSYAGVVSFSIEASDNDAPLSNFNAQLVYSFDALTNVFTMTVVNQTVAPAGYTISEIVFNVSDDVTGLTLVGNGGFAAAQLAAIERGDGFGWFDWGLDLGLGNIGVPANSSATFTFNVTGSNLDEGDFFSGVSWGAGLTPAIAAMHFQNGPGGDSAWTIGGLEPQRIIPEPTTMVLLGLGIAGMVVARKRLS